MLLHTTNCVCSSPGCCPRCHLPGLLCPCHTTNCRLSDVLPADVQLRGGTDDLACVGKPPKPQMSLMTADVPGAQAKPAWRPRAARTAPAPAALSALHQTAQLATSTQPLCQRPSSTDCGATARHEAPPSGIGYAAASQAVIHVPLDVSDIVVWLLVQPSLGAMDLRHMFIRYVLA